MNHSLVVCTIVIWLAVRYWNGKHAGSLSSLSPITILWSLLNYANLECVQRHINTAQLWRGDSKLLSFVGSVVAVVCGHLALIQMKNGGAARPLRIATRVALLCAYPYLIYWSLLLLAWLQYAWIMSGYHGP